MVTGGVISTSTASIHASRAAAVAARSRTVRATARVSWSTHVNTNTGSGDLLAVAADRRLHSLDTAARSFPGAEIRAVATLVRSSSDARGPERYVHLMAASLKSSTLTRSPALAADESAAAPPSTSLTSTSSPE